MKTPPLRNASPFLPFVASPGPRICAWTGGSSPRPPSEVSRAETSIRSYLFREQVETFRTYWHADPEWDVFRIFAARARYDAHATVRDAARR